MCHLLTFLGTHHILHVSRIRVKQVTHNKNQREALISQIYFGIELYIFRTGLLSIIRSLVLYTQQYTVMLTVC